MNKRAFCLLLLLFLTVSPLVSLAVQNAITSTVDLGPLANVDVFADPAKPPVNSEDQGISLGTEGQGFFPSASWQGRACFTSTTKAANTFVLSLYAPDQEVGAGVVSNPPVLVRDSQGYPNPVTVRLINKGFLDNLTTTATANAVRMTSQEISVKIDAKVDTLVFVVAGAGAKQFGAEAGFKVVCLYDGDMDQIALPRIAPAWVPGSAGFQNVTQAALAYTDGHECLISYPMVKSTGPSSAALAWYAYAIYPNRRKVLKNITLSAPVPSHAEAQDASAGVYLLALSYKKTPLAEMVMAAPSYAESYKPFMVTLTAQDGYGWIERNYDQTVHFSSTDPWFVTQTATPKTVTVPFLPVDYKFIPEYDKGIRSFWVNLATPGSSLLSVEEVGNSERRGSASMNVDKSKVLQALTDARLSRANLCLLPTAYTGHEDHESGLSLSSSFDFCWYIGKLYYYENGKANFTDRIGTSMLSMDGKAGFIEEGAYNPAVAGGLWGGYIFPLGNDPTKQQSLDKFSSAPLFDFFLVASKRFNNKWGVHSGYIWGNIASLLPTIDPLVASNEPVGLPSSTTIPAQLFDFPKHAVYMGVDYPLIGKINLKMEFILPYEVKDVYLINTQLEHFTSFDLAYIKHPYGYALLGWINVRVMWFPSN